MASSKEKWRTREKAQMGESVRVQRASISGGVEAGSEREEMGMSREKPRPCALMESKEQEGYEKERRI